VGPVRGDIPLLGYAFRQQELHQAATNLVFIITPDGLTMQVPLQEAPPPSESNEKTGRTTRYAQQHYADRRRWGTRRYLSPELRKDFCLLQGRTVG